MLSTAFHLERFKQLDRSTFATVMSDHLVNSLRRIRTEALDQGGIKLGAFRCGVQKKSFLFESIGISTRQFNPIGPQIRSDVSKFI